MNTQERRHDPARLPGATLAPGTRIRRLQGPIGYGLAFAAIAIAMSVLLVRHGNVGAEITAIDLGQPAKFDVRAIASTYVPDSATTKRLREEVARATPIIYRRTQGVLEKQLETLREVFGGMREGFEAYDAAVRAAQKAAAIAPKTEGAGANAPKKPEGAAKPATTVRADAKSKGEGEPVREADIVERSAARRVLSVPSDGPSSREGRALAETAHAPILRALHAFLGRSASETARRISLSPAEMDALARTRFSKAAEETVARLLSRVQGGVVVRDKVKFLVDVSAGVVLASAGASDLVQINRVMTPSDALDVAVARTRIGEAARAELPDAPPAVREAIASCARRLVAENLVHDGEATLRSRARARDSVQQQYRFYPARSTILRQGDIVRPEHLALVDATAPTESKVDLTRSYIGHALFVVLIGVVTFLRSRARIARHRPSLKDFLFMGLMALVTLAFMRLSLEVAEVLHDRWTDVPLAAFALLVPVAVGAVLVRLVLTLDLALIFSTAVSLLIAIMAGGGAYLAAYAFVGASAGAIAAGRVRQRVQILKTGIFIALAQTGAVVCLALAGGQGGFPTRIDAQLATPEQGLFAVAFLHELGAAATSGFLAALVALALVALAEGVFGYVTIMKYQELGSLENPLLKELFMRAPGTYHHSVVAGALAEAAAEAIGANGALARVGAYYHDVGKGKCPHYFAENQRGENPHDKLAPHMSALILRRHVDDGVEILKQHRLPRPIIDICAQHLGTTLTEYFFVRAARLADEQGLPPPIEDDFRYSGPKPQFREAAIVFIADSVEAAGRAIADPTQPKLDEMVRRIIRNKFTDGQLDECDLTLRDLDAIAKAMSRVLVAIHHTRPQYPSQQRAEAAAAMSATQPGLRTELEGLAVARAEAAEEEAAVVDPDAPIDLSDHRRRSR